jgi:hypothetical protein
VKVRRRLACVAAVCILAVALAGCAKQVTTSVTTAPEPTTEAVTKANTPVEAHVTFAQQIAAPERTSRSVSLDTIGGKLEGMFGGSDGYYNWQRNAPQSFVIFAINIKGFVSQKQYQQILAAENPLSQQTLEAMWTLTMDVPVEKRTDKSGLSTTFCAAKKVDSVSSKNYFKKWDKYDAVTSKGRYPFSVGTISAVLDASGQPTGKMVGVAHLFDVDTDTSLVTFAPYIYLYDASSSSFSYTKQVKWLN